MRFMNEYEIDDRAQQFADHPLLGPATRTLVSLRDWTNRNSDGWAYWPLPCRAAKSLIELIEGDGTAQYRFDTERKDVTRAKLTKALSPIKAFRTRQNADFVIYEEPMTKVRVRQRHNAVVVQEDVYELTGEEFRQFAALPECDREQFVEGFRQIHSHNEIDKLADTISVRVEVIP